MIRFQPDTLLEAFTRFFDMAAPDANVYIEVPAPDVRMGALALLALAAVLCWRWLRGRRTPTFAMLAVLLVSTAIWLPTTGNGRYFLPMLVCAGPIAIGLLCLLPLKREWKALLGVSLASVQVFVLTQQSPWHSWEWVDWTEAPYFAIDMKAVDTGGAPTTYATISTISYSLVAPQFPANSRWISLSSAGATPRDDAVARDFLRRAAAEGPVRLLAPAIPGATLPDGRPNEAAITGLDQLISPRNLRIAGQCHMIHSVGMEKMQGIKKSSIRAAAAAPVGFWSCPLAYAEDGKGVARQPDPPKQVLDALRQMGQLCPRFFPMTDENLLRLPDGWVKHYGSDARIYVMDNDQVWYKFWRSLNPVFVGRMTDVAAGNAKLDCSAIRGDDRPWRTGAQ